MNDLFLKCLTILYGKFVISLFTAFVNIMSLLFIQKVLDRRYRYNIIRTVACGVFNGFIIFLAIRIFGSIFSPMYMLSIALLINLELFFIGEAKLIRRLHILSITLGVYSCLYVFSLAFLNFCFRYNSDISAHLYYYRLAFVLSLIVTLVCSCILLKFGKTIVVMFKTISKTFVSGALSLVYNFSVCIIMVFSAFVMLPTLLSERVSLNFTMVHSFYEMFVSLMLLVVSFSVIFIQYRLANSLGYEKTLRLNIQRNALISYSFNATKDILDKNVKIFKNNLWEGSTSYFKMISNFIQKCVHPDDQKELLNMSSLSYPWSALASYNGSLLTMRIRISPKQLPDFINMPDYIKHMLESVDKEWRWSEMSCIVTKEAATGNVIVNMSFIDIDDKVSQEEELKKAANYDTLTGILNRGTVENQIKAYLASGKVDGALFLIDLDHFKEVNDILGHGKGDELLKETATMIKNVFRNSDIVGRLGGDEFVAFCKGTTDKEFLARRAKELNEKGYRCHEVKNGDDIYTSMSIGIAVCPDDGADFATLYGNADISLYKAKSAGRNRFCFFVPGLELKLFDFDFDGLRLNIPHIDDQHKKIVDMTNDFMQLLLSGTDIEWKEHAYSLINGMLSYSQEHFSFEEKIMEEINFSRLDIHKKQHDDFVMYAATRFTAFDSMNRDDAMDLLNFLKNWLIKHISGEDKLYREEFINYFSTHESTE